MTSIEMRSRRSAFFIVERRSPLTLTLSRLPLTLRDAGLYITRPEKHEDFLQRRRIANIFLPAIKIFSLSSPLRIFLSFNSAIISSCLGKFFWNAISSKNMRVVSSRRVGFAISFIRVTWDPPSRTNREARALEANRDVKNVAWQLGFRVPCATLGVMASLQRILRP